MTTPLYDSLTGFAAEAPLRLHMPGHKGQLDGVFRDFSRIDFTELPPVGNLYDGTGAAAEAEALFAEAAGAGSALFFSCGATQGIFTMLAAAVGMGGTLVLDRNCHKSVYHGMGLMDISPVYLCPPLIEETGLPEPISPALLETALRAHPEAKAVLLTTPSYYGVMTDLRPLAEICCNYGVYLLADQAHGAHFPFIGLPSAVQEGADLCVVSAHKTLPALGSASVLLAGEKAPWDALRLKEISSVFATTSPSWPILASIDYARGQLQKNDGYIRTGAAVRALRETICRDTPFRALRETSDMKLDPCRLAVDTACAGLSGREADRLLQNHNIYVEMADERYLVAIITCQDTAEDLDRFLAGLKSLPAGAACLPPVTPPPPIVPRCSIRQALFGPAEPARLMDAAGRISAQTVDIYPPGAPILAPGEEITEKHIAYLQKKSYNIEKTVSVIP